MENTFTTVATFQYSSEAQIIKGRLLAEGIEAFLADNYTIDTDPLVSNAIGGVKLKVATRDLDKTKEVLNSISSYSLNNEGERVVCPNCNSNKTELFTTITDAKSLGAFLVGMLFGALPFYTRYQYRCENCKHKFNQDE